MTDTYWHCCRCDETAPRSSETWGHDVFALDELGGWFWDAVEDSPICPGCVTERDRDLGRNAFASWMRSLEPAEAWVTEFREHAAAIFREHEASGDD